MGTNENMKTFMKALFQFDKIFNHDYPENVSQKSLFIIEHLIAQKLKRESNVKFPPFIVDCFHVFTQNKKQIDINLIRLHENKTKMIDLIFHPLEKRDKSNETTRSDDDSHNVLRADLFDIFPNFKRMNIYSASMRISFSFSLIYFLKVLAKAPDAKWSEIVI